jgi:hypothetical protein
MKKTLLFALIGGFAVLQSQAADTYYQKVTLSLTGYYQKPTLTVTDTETLLKTKDSVVAVKLTQADILKYAATWLADKNADGTIVASKYFLAIDVANPTEIVVTDGTANVTPALLTLTKTGVVSGTGYAYPQTGATNSTYTQYTTGSIVNAADLGDALTGFTLNFGGSLSEKFSEKVQGLDIVDSTIWSGSLGATGSATIVNPLGTTDSTTLIITGGTVKFTGVKVK